MTLTAEVEEDHDLGATPAERLRRVELARRVSWVAHGVAALVVIGSWVLPMPQWDFVALACVPLVVIGMLCFSHGAYRLDGSRFSLRPRLALLLLVLAAVLAVHASGIRLLHAHDGWLLAAAGAAGFAVLLDIANRRMGQSRRKMLVYALALGTWGFGAGALFNAARDAAPPEAFRAKVLNKTISKGKSGKSQSPMISLAPWGPMDQGSRLSVDWDLYDAPAEGKDACVTLHAGVLGVRWYVVQARAP